MVGEMQSLLSTKNLREHAFDTNSMRVNAISVKMYNIAKKIPCLPLTTKKIRVIREIRVQNKESRGCR